jgi:hypothetical protein
MIMADLDDTTAAEQTEGQVDPISEAQNRVMEAKALLECIETLMESQGVASNYRGTDLISACSGVINILAKLVLDLDPQQFRKAVLASESTAEVANG